MILKLEQCDITSDFMHADLDEDNNVFVDIPMGFRKKGKVVKLNTNLYGLRQSTGAFWGIGNESFYKKTHLILT